jgi:hypothetical protein
MKIRIEGREGNALSKETTRELFGLWKGSQASRRQVLR